MENPLKEREVLFICEGAVLMSISNSITKF